MNQIESNERSPIFSEAHIAIAATTLAIGAALMIDGILHRNPDSLSRALITFGVGTGTFLGYDLRYLSRLG